jgi:hypothetical protein
MPTRTFGPFIVNRRRVNTRITVKAGDRIGVVARGEIDFGGAALGLGAPILTADGDDWPTPADYPAPNLRKNSLVCDIGGTLFQGGVNRSFLSTSSGQLALFPNDNQLGDNSRGWEVTVYHSFSKPPSPGAPPPPPPDPVLGNWLFYTLDGVGGIFGANCGFCPSAVFFQGRAHVFHGELAGAFKLRHLDFDPLQDIAVGETFGSGPPPAPDRDLDVLDGEGGASGRTTDPAGWVSAAVVHDGQIHVLYTSQSSGGPFTLRHASSADGTSWQLETVDGAGSANGRVRGDVVRFLWSSIATASWRNELHAFYFGVTDLDQGEGPDGRGAATGVLRHAVLPASGGWRFEVLDGQGGANGRVDATTAGFVGQTVAAVVDRNNRLHVFYTNASPQLGEEGEPGITNLRHAWSDNGSEWRFETLDGQGGPDGRIRALVGLFPVAIEFDNVLHVFYRDSTHGNVRHGAFDGSRWSFQALDGTGGRNGRTKASVWPLAAAKLADRLSVFIWDDTNDDLRHAYWLAANWQFEILDGNSSDRFGRISASVGERAAAVAFDPRRLGVFYRDATSTDLRYAEFVPRP